jgi:hypothetical protein
MRPGYAAGASVRDGDLARAASAPRCRCVALSDRCGATRSVSEGARHLVQRHDLHRFRVPLSVRFRVDSAAGRAGCGASIPAAIPPEHCIPQAPLSSLRLVSAPQLIQTSWRAAHDPSSTFSRWSRRSPWAQGQALLSCPSATTQIDAGRRHRSTDVRAGGWASPRDGHWNRPSRLRRGPVEVRVTVFGIDAERSSFSKVCWAANGVLQHGGGN